MHVVLAIVFAVLTMAALPLVAAAPALASTGVGSSFCSAYGSLSSSQVQLDNVYPCANPNISDGFGYQCVEYSARFESMVYGIPSSWAGGPGWNVVNELHQHGVPASSPNGSSGGSSAGSNLPAPGDVISMWGPGQDPAGHTGVIEAVNVSNGTGSITYYDENGWQSNGVSRGYDVISVSPSGWSDNMGSSFDYTLFNWTVQATSTPTSPPPDTDGDGVPNSADWCPKVAGTPFNHGCPNNDIQISGDLNGDGKADVIAISRDISDNSPYIYWFPSISTTGAPSLADPVFLEHLPAPGWNMNNLKWAVGDFNGDGKADLFVASGDPGTGAVVMYILLSTGTGLAPPVLVKQPSLAWQWPLLTFMTGDVNGDGKADVIAISRDADSSPYIYSFDSTSAGSTPSLADPVFLEHLPAPGWNMNNLKWAVGDFNGDGKADLFVASGDPGTGAVVMYILLSTGTGLAPPVLVKQPSLAWQWPLLTF